MKMTKPTETIDTPNPNPVFISPKMKMSEKSLKNQRTRKKEEQKNRQRAERK